MVRTNEAVRWPYTKREYVKRALWGVVHKTLWRISWKRFYKLRAIQLRFFGATVTNHISLAGTVQIFAPWDLKCGSYTSISDRVNIYNLGAVEIGEHVVISQDVYICGGTHDYTKSNYPLIRKPIVIGNSVWICAGAFIGPGVVIGDGAVIGSWMNI